MLGLISLDTDKNFSLQTVTVDCDVYNSLATCTIAFLYKNITGQNTEALFSCPKDIDWLTYHFQSDIGGKTLFGKCKDVDEANKLHKAAVDSGQREIVIESDNAMEIYKFCVGNVVNGGDAKITIKLAILLKLSAEKSDFKDADRFNLSLPMMARPRYNAIDASGDVGIYNVANPFQYTFQASFRGTQIIKNVSSINNKLRLTYSDNKQIHGQAVLESKYDDTKEFILDIDYAKSSDPTVLFISGTDKNDHGDFCKPDMAVIEFVPQFESKKMEIIFMVDRSDSMAGSDMQQTKKCVQYYLKNLPTNCMFQIYGFGTYFDKAFMQPVCYNEETMKTAMEYQKKMSADFDLTDFMLPLKNMFSYPLVNGHERVIFLLTDGDVSNREEVVKLMTQNNKSTSLYCIGLGAGVSGAFLRKLAAAGNGESAVVKNSQILPAKFQELFDKVIKLNPFSIDKMEWKCPNTATIDVFPEKPDPVLAHNCLRIFGTVKNLKKGDTIQGKLTTTYNGKSMIMNININANESIVDNEFTAHRIVTKNHMDLLMEEADNGNQDSKKALIKMSVDANITTKFTTLLAVDKAVPNKGVLVSDTMDPLLYYKPTFQTENFTRKKDKNVKKSEDSGNQKPRQIWIRSNVKEATQGNIIIFLADKQNIDGSWDCDPQLIWRLGLDPKTVEEHKPEFISKEIWMTIIVFEFLATKLSTSEKEWQLLAKKAKEHIYVNLKESSVMSMISGNDEFNGITDIIGFIQHVIKKALEILKATLTPLGQITAKAIEGTSSDKIPERRKYEIVFVVDRSGSMTGVKVESAKQCLFIFMKSLPDNCKFQIYGFGSSFDKAFPNYLDYNDDSMQLGLAYQYKIDASFGNTELMNPLRDLYNARLTNDFTRLVFILTDGQISNENEAVQLVRQHNSVNKVYAIGIGSDVSTTLVNKLAEAGLGKAVFVKESSCLSAVVMDLLTEVLFSRN